jgi:hypothetical protein
VIGGWIARHELVARQRGRYDAEDMRPAASATAFLVGWWKSLLMCCPCVLFLMLVFLLPVVLAGWMNAWLGGVGALLVSLCLPILLFADLLLFAIALGAVAWPLMPVALAAECRDVFDALSRSYSYAFQRPVRFLLLTATAIGLAGLPFAVRYAFADQIAAWQPEARQTVDLLAAALSLSIFWSLQTLVYLHLRLAIDEVDAGEVATGAPLPATASADAGQAPKAASVPATGATAPAASTGLLRATVLWLALAVGSWWLTYRLLTHAGGGQTAWLGWGLTETLVPPAEGVYRVASVIAGLWGALWLALPVLWLVAKLRSRGAAH